MDYKTFSETLISRHDSQESDDVEFQMELSEQRNDNFTDTPSPAPAGPSPSKTWAWIYVISASVMASLGGVLFGYDIGKVYSDS